MDTPDSSTKGAARQKSKLYAVAGQIRMNRLVLSELRLRCVPRALPRARVGSCTKAAQRRCTIMTVLCVKAVTSGNRGMKIATGFRPLSR
ncbi:hypothetical protein [Paraburkholderia sp. 40]|uniref:hypothetical protein n=1 Tax=Paraburkholderia sp. 40 TaxID=2991059 RepID=UPI003D1A2844